MWTKGELEKAASEWEYNWEFSMDGLKEILFEDKPWPIAEAFLAGCEYIISNAKEKEYNMEYENSYSTHCKEGRKEVGTTYEQQQLLWQLGYEAYGWMRDATGRPECDTLDEAIEELAHDCGDTYEVVVRLHLQNQKVIELHNNCFDSVTKHGCYDAYLGDNILVSDKGGTFCASHRTYEDEDKVTLLPLVRLEYTDKQGNYHQSWLPISQVCYVDVFSVELEWKKIWSKLPHEERELRRNLWLKRIEEEKQKQKQ